MSASPKTVVATGASSGLGFEAVKQLLEQSEISYKFIVGCRDVKAAEAAYGALKYDAAIHSVTFLPVDLANLKDVRPFATKVLEILGDTKIDYLFLNAGMIKDASGPGPNDGMWCTAYVVNHLSHHYFVSLLKGKLEKSQSRIVFVSSGAIKRVDSLATLVPKLKANSGTEAWDVYSATKMVQLMNALYWRKQLKTSGVTVVAVSPGLIPGTGIARNTGMELSSDMPDAKTVPEGARSLLQAFFRNDLPEDEDQIFLTSWGEWWPTDVYKLALNYDIGARFSPPIEGIERENKLV